LISREDILRRFEEWLDATLTQEGPPPGIPAEVLSAEENGAESASTDLHAMWASMTALTQEVKLQGRAFKQMSETLVRETERRSRREVLDALLEMRERMLRGLDTVRGRQELQPAFVDRIFPARWQKIQRSLEVVEALEEGQQLALQSLDDLLAQFMVRPIECAGQFFDPRRMNAVAVEETNAVMDGTVVQVYRTGYEWNGEVYRPAQVRVARSSQKARNE
jgi:molecular chaperone GrpE